MPIYLKYGKIDGEVKEPVHRKWIELTSAQFGVNKSMTSPTGGFAERGGSPTFKEIVVTKKSDSTSVHLMREALSGEGVVAKIEFTRADGSVYLRVELTGTLISSYIVSGTGGNSTESFSLNFTEIKFQFTPGTPYGFDDVAADVAL